MWIKWRCLNAGEIWITKQVVEDSRGRNGYRAASSKGETPRSDRTHTCQFLNAYVTILYTIYKVLLYYIHISYICNYSERVRGCVVSQKKIQSSSNQIVLIDTCHECGFNCCVTTRESRWIWTPYKRKL